MYGRVWKWKDTSAAWLRKRQGDRERENEREERYGPTGVAMETQLLKAGRVSVEECAARAKGMPHGGHFVN